MARGHASPRARDREARHLDLRGADLFELVDEAPHDAPDAPLPVQREAVQVRTADEHRWDPQHRRIDPALLLDVDARGDPGGAKLRLTGRRDDRGRRPGTENETMPTGAIEVAAEDKERIAGGFFNQS